MVGNQALIDHYQNVHATTLYGNSSIKYLRFLRPEIAVLDPKSVLDYGCGQSRLLDMLGLDGTASTFRYDPAIPEFSYPVREEVDLLINIDVLEHIEECDLDDVLAEMRALCRDAIIVVDTKAAEHVLSDGRNAHVSLHNADWWADRLAGHFGELRKIATPRRSRAGFATWKLDAPQQAKVNALKAWEKLRYYTLRSVNRHELAWNEKAHRAEAQ